MFSVTGIYSSVRSQRHILLNGGLQEFIMIGIELKGFCKEYAPQT